MSDRAVRAIQRTGALDVLFPPDDDQRRQAVRRVIDPAGGIDPQTALHIQGPIRMGWGPGSTQRHEAEQPMTAIRLAAYASSPPGGGNCIVTFTMVSELSGEETIGSVSITSGQSTGQTNLVYPIPGGAWVGASVTSASGASGVSASLVARAGG